MRTVKNGPWVPGNRKILDQKPESIFRKILPIFFLFLKY